MESALRGIIVNPGNRFKRSLRSSQRTQVPLRGGRRLGPRAIIAAAGILLLLAGTGPAAQAASPKCFGKRATLVGTSGDDFLRGTKRADVIVARGGRDIVRAKAGNDLVCAGAGHDLVRGEAGRDKIKGGDGQDRLWGSSGNDVIISGFFRWDDQGQLDLLAGGDGDDTLLGSGALDAIRGGKGNDLIRGRGNNDNLYAEVVTGGAGADRIKGGTVVQQGYGSLGEVFVGGPGDDIIDGGEAGEPMDRLDVVAYWASPRRVTVSLLDGTATGQGEDTLVDIGGVVGSFSDDDITGDGESNLMHPLDGSDVVDAGDGDDVVEGDDFIRVNLSQRPSFVPRVGCRTVCDDALEGGGGNDTVGGGVGADLVEGGTGMDILVGGDLVERFRGFDRSDDMLHGGDGDDALYGGSFNVDYGPIAHAHDGNDELQGEAGDDSLNGQADDDVLDGGLGSNTNDGGPGVDTCTNPDTAGGATNCESP